METVRHEAVEGARGLGVGLSSGDRAVLIQRTAAVADLAMRERRDRRELAANLVFLRDFLRPRRLWNRWLRLRAVKKVGLSRATIFRVIAEYEPKKRMEIVPPRKKRAVRVIGVEEAVETSFRQARATMQRLPVEQRGEAVDQLAGMLFQWAGLSRHQVQPIQFPRAA